MTKCKLRLAINNERNRRFKGKYCACPSGGLARYPVYGLKCPADRFKWQHSLYYLGVQAEISSAAPKFLFQNFIRFPQSLQAYAGILYPNCYEMTPAGKSGFFFTLIRQVNFFGREWLLSHLLTARLLINFSHIMTVRTSLFTSQTTQFLFLPPLMFPPSRYCVPSLGTRCVLCN